MPLNAIPQRQFGKHDVKISVIGYGGHHLGDAPDEPTAVHLREACRFDASDGHLELFKTTKKYDGDLGREQQGFPSAQELPL
jgi:hypothetical protein